VLAAGSPHCGFELHLGSWAAPIRMQASSAPALVETVLAKPDANVVLDYQHPNRPADLPSGCGTQLNHCISDLRLATALVGRAVMQTGNSVWRDLRVGHRPYVQARRRRSRRRRHRGRRIALRRRRRRRRRIGTGRLHRTPCQSGSDQASANHDGANERRRDEWRDQNARPKPAGRRHVELAGDPVSQVGRCWPHRWRWELIKHRWH
jgi:hypothetical protein